MATQGVLGAATLKEFEDGLHGELIQPGDGAYDEAVDLERRPRRPPGGDRPLRRRRRRAPRGRLRAQRGARRRRARRQPQHSRLLDRRGRHRHRPLADEGHRGRRETPPPSAPRGALTWGELDAATQEHGLATTGGLISTTGVAGFTLGGGIGWLMRKHGLACDNLRSAEVVTADGQILTASATENPDLFWGLRGGGGNFGVVTTFEFDLHPVGPTVAAGPVFYPGDRAEEIMRFYRDFARDLPDELTTLVNLITAPPAPFLPEDWHGKKLIALVGCYSGDPEEGMKVLQPIRDLGDPVADLVGPMPYVQMQSLLDALWPKGTQAYMKAGYFRELDDHAIETMARFHQNATSPSSEIHIQHFGGAIARVGRGRDRLRGASGALRAQRDRLDPRADAASTPTSTGRSVSTQRSSRR